MEHRHIASFGPATLCLAAATALVAPGLVAVAAPSVAAPGSEQAAKGPYRGAYVCQIKLAGVPAPGIFRVPVDLVIRNGTVEFSRPLLSGGIGGRRLRVVGNEMASGTIDADGKVHLTSTWFNSGAVFHADYSGTLTPSGGTFMGTQRWRGPRGQNGSRTCTAALVQLAATNQSAPQQSPPDQTPLQQPPADQAPLQQSLPDQTPRQQLPLDRAPLQQLPPDQTSPQQ